MGRRAEDSACRRGGLAPFSPLLLLGQSRQGQWPRPLLGPRSSKCLFSSPSHGGHMLPERPLRWPSAVPGHIPGPMEVSLVSPLCLSSPLLVPGCVPTGPPQRGHRVKWMRVQHQPASKLLSARLRTVSSNAESRT